MRSCSMRAEAAVEEVLDGFKYTSSHEWVKHEGSVATIGISDHAQDHLGEVVFVDLPESGASVSKGGSFGAVESVKATSDVNSPVSGEIVEVNTKLTETPGLINSSPYEGGWMIKVKPNNASELESLMGSKEYTKFLNQALVTLAMFGVGVNLVSFMTDVLDQDKAKAANSVSNWSGTAYMFSLGWPSSLPELHGIDISSLVGSGNPISRFSQVIVAASMKWRTRLPSDETDLYETDGNKRGSSGSGKILHTTDFRFLDKTAVVKPEDSMRLGRATARSPWHLCPVTQVEEVKCIIRLLPIWLCTIIYSVVYMQMAFIFTEQGDTMKSGISRFHIASASMSIFEILSVSASILLYRLYLVPLYCRFQKGDKKEIPELQRMGFGLLIAVLGMVSSGCEAASSQSDLWQIPQYVLIGISEAFTYVGMLEFFNKETPDGLKSIGSALYMASMALGSYMSTLLVTLVMKITGSGEHLGWIPDNLNKGHLDRFYHLLAALAAVDLVMYVTCAKCYKCISLDRDDSMEDANCGRELSQFSSIPE
ncbi:Nitrate transporter 1.5 [Acorus gramineus]|uniref:Nitrate transporter 1.5 n=1 Tax=Acorus gramineus TaxID=55184 RepID=A0AAV9B9R1_ACOGR|nr:Nitrate transporter 1.5 [Acorus gramineus]